MARSKLQYWLNEGKDNLIEIIQNSHNDVDIYPAMGINKATFYRYCNNEAFCDLIKNEREKRIEENTKRLKQLHEDMWKRAHEQVITETIKEVEEKNGQQYKYMKETTKTLPGDATLMIYLDKTYGNNINSEEIKSRIELNKVRAEVQRMILDPDLDESTKAKLDAVRKILGGVESVIGKAK